MQASAMAAFMSESIVYFGIGFGASAVVALSLTVILPVVNRRALRLEARSASQLVELGRGDAIKALKTDLGALSARLRATEEELKVKTTAAREAECGLSDKESELAKVRSALGERVALVDLQKTELVAADMQVEALKGRLAQMGEEVKAAEERRHRAERALSDKEMEMAKLTSAFRERSLLADSQKLEIMVVGTQVQALQERLIQCDEEAKALEALREAAECALSERDSKLVTTMRALDDRSVLADSQKGEIAALAMQIQTLQGRVTQSDEEVNAVESRHVAALRSLSEKGTSDRQVGRGDASWEGLAERFIVDDDFHVGPDRRATRMTRLARLLLVCALLLGGGRANAQAGAAPPTAEPKEIVSTQPPTADDVCRTLEQAAAENSLPVEFFARVIWQESRFNARAVSPKGAAGIAQFMPQTASWHGLADPFDPIEALRHSASYLHELRDRFGNLGLAAAAYNAGPGRVSEWLASHRQLPGETRSYVATVTGRGRSVDSESRSLHAAGQPDPSSEAAGGTAH